MKRFLYGFTLISIFLIIIIASSKVFSPKKYKIKFDTNGGTLVNSVLIKENELIDKLPVSNKKGYEFVGWYLNDLPFSQDIKIKQDYTLVAKWKILDAKKYTVFFDSLGGTLVEPIVIEEGQTLSDLPLPTKEGYEFLYWLYQNKELKDFKVTKDLTLVAKWKKIID